jgi:hypothetical protein
VTQASHSAISETLLTLGPEKEEYLATVGPNLGTTRGGVILVTNGFLVGTQARLGAERTHLGTTWGLELFRLSRHNS